MSKERKSQLIRSYIYEEEDDIIEDSLDDSKVLKDEDLIKVEDNIGARNSDPLLSNNEQRNSNLSNHSNHSKHSNRSSRSKFTGENVEDKQLLYDMGFKSQLINTIYNNMHPINITEALDYLNKNDQGKFTHSYIENERFICTICSQGRYAHESTVVFLENNNNLINSNAGTITGNTGNNAGTTANNKEIDLNIINNNNTNTNNNNILNTNTNSSSRPNRLSSERYNRLENSYLTSLNKKNKDYNYNYSYSKPKDCGICGDKIEYPDISKVSLKCGHYFCIDCWENYLKEKINNANVAKISCMQHGCSAFLTENFVKSILENEDAIIKKYEKFLERQKILMSDKNVKFCPIPDCDGFAEKKKNKYVKCNFGHDFCFDCLKQPHGKKECDEMIDEGFEEWKKHKIIKRCPNCNFWTEKNEGCNHMTCVECKFQWCWLCQKKYSAGHYNTGSCKGLQFEKEQDEEKIRKMLEANLKKYPPPKPPKCQCLRKAIKEFFIFLFFVFFAPYFFLFRITDENYYLGDCLFFVYSVSVVPTFISFEIFFFSINLIFALPGLLLFRKYRDLYHYVKDPFEY